MIRLRNGVDSLVIKSVCTWTILSDIKGNISF